MRRLYDPEWAAAEVPAAVHIWDFSADGSTVVGWTYLPDGDGGVLSTATRWVYDTLEPQFLGVPEDWGWAHANSVSADGSVVAGYVGRRTVDAEGEPTVEFEGMFWTEETGIRNMSDYLLEEFGYDLGGNRFGNLSVSADGELFSGVVETAAGPKILQLWRSPYRVLHAYPPPGKEEGPYITRSSRDGSALGGPRSVREPPSDSFPQGRAYFDSMFWTEPHGFRSLDFDPDGSGEHHENEYFLTGISADGNFIVGRTWGPRLATVGFRYDIRLGGFETLSIFPRWLSANGQLAVSDGGFLHNGERTPRIPHIIDFRHGPESDGFATSINIGSFGDELPYDFIISPLTMSDDGTRMVGQIHFFDAEPPLANARFGFTWDSERGLRVLGPDGLGVPVDQNTGHYGASPFSLSGDGSVFSGDLVAMDGSFRRRPVLWDFETLEMIELGLPDGYESGSALSKAYDGSVVTGSASQAVEFGGETITESTSWLWTQETGLIDLQEYFLARFGPARESNHLVGARITADGKHLYGVLEWGERRELVRLSRPVGWESALDRVAGDLRRRADGSIESDWLGAFFEHGGGWIYHAEHGWLAPRSGDTGNGGLLVYDANLRSWTWTDELAYPWMYAFGSVDQWVWYVPGGTPEGRWFYYLEEENWVFHGDADDANGGNGDAAAPEVLAAGNRLRFEGIFTEDGFSDDATLDVEVLTPTTASITYTEPNEGFSIGPLTLPFAYEVTEAAAARIVYGAGDPDFSGELNLLFTSASAGTFSGTQRDEGVEMAFAGTFSIFGE